MHEALGGPVPVGAIPSCITEYTITVAYRVAAQWPAVDPPGSSRGEVGGASHRLVPEKSCIVSGAYLAEDLPLQPIAPWLVLLAFSALTWWATPRRVDSSQFFDGRRNDGHPPGVLMVAMSAAITWVFAKSLANASDLAYGYGLTGGVGYTIYYLSFVVAGVAIYLLRTRGSYRSLPHFLVSKYGIQAAKLFMILVTFRLVNEIWSNTKVMSLYFGSEGSGSYWTAVELITGFTIAYAWRGGMRASLTTDRIHIFLAFVLLALVLTVLFPGLEGKGIPTVAQATRDSGITFCLLALVQIFSYPFHDPVLTDRGFLNWPAQALRSFLLAAVLSGSFIFLFSIIGLYGLAFGLRTPASVTVPGTFGLAMLMVFNAIMLMTGGSTIDSTLTSIAKLAGRDWPSGRASSSAWSAPLRRLATCISSLTS